MAGTDADTAAHRGQPLSRGIAVLRAMAEAREPVTLQDLHHDTSIPKPTLVRLLAILTREGCTVRLDDRPTYALGPTVALLAAAVGSDQDLEALAQPYLDQVVEALGHTVNLGVLSGGGVLRLCVTSGGDGSGREPAAVGSMDDVHATGLGKALVAQLSNGAVDRMLPTTLTARTEHTITTRAALDAELRQVRQQGYAHDAEEGVLGLSCFAVPVSVAGRGSAALSVSGPAGALSADRADTVVPVLREVAGRMAADPQLAKALLAHSRD